MLAFHDLGMEAIYEFEVQDMPVTVAVDACGNSVHELGPKQWQAKIEELVEIGGRCILLTIKAAATKSGGLPSAVLISAGRHSFINQVVTFG